MGVWVIWAWEILECRNCWSSISISVSLIHSRNWKLLVIKISNPVSLCIELIDSHNWFSCNISDTFHYYVDLMKSFCLFLFSFPPSFSSHISSHQNPSASLRSINCKICSSFLNGWDVLTHLFWPNCTIITRAVCCRIAVPVSVSVLEQPIQLNVKYLNKNLQNNFSDLGIMHLWAVLQSN
jgi:hypothetical protein